MARFKQVPQTYVFKNIVRFWSNMVKNFESDVRDADFFDVVHRGFDHDKAVDLIKSAFSEGEMQMMTESKCSPARIDLTDSLDVLFKSLWNRTDRDRVKVILRSVGECMLADCKKPSKPEPIEKRFASFAKSLGLNELELDIAIVAFIKCTTCFEWPRCLDDSEKPLFYAMALDRSYGEVLEALSPKGRLQRFGVLDNDWDFSRHYVGFFNGTDAEALERRFYRVSEGKDVLPWEFYGELATKDGTLIRDMIKAAKGKENILFYGAPGTGKTSFARTLAKELGLTAFEIKQGDDNGKNMTAESRLVGIQICNEQEDPRTSMMIVDEADELLRDGSGGFDPFGFSFRRGKSTEKGVTNTILDEMRMPAIWISNAPACAMDESVRRRFDYSVCFEQLNDAQRQSIWRNVVKRLDLTDVVGGEKIAELASKYKTSAGGISVVMENVRKLGASAENVDEMIDRLMKPHCKLMEVRPSDKFLPAKGYSLDGLNIRGKVKLDRVVKAVGNYLDDGFNAKADDRPRMNILMYGAPGTGKTEFVKYLGKTLDRKVLVMKGSDILGMYVGQSEQNIARAFRRAEQEHAILFFDEIDGLVQDREGADHSWEVSQVNELLQQMENFNGVMVAATNFSRNLDAAIMRRFTFKLEFDYLDDDGKRKFFERTFKTTLTDGEMDELKAIPNLAPGDFRTVRQEQFYLDAAQSNLDRIAALREECALKKDGHSARKIGF